MEKAARVVRYFTSMNGVKGFSYGVFNIFFNTWEPQELRENYGATYDSMTRNIISIIPMKMSPNGYRFVDVFFNQNIYSDTIIDESRRFERYWINSETEKIAALSIIMEEE